MAEDGVVFAELVGVIEVGERVEDLEVVPLVVVSVWLVERLVDVEWLVDVDVARLVGVELECEVEVVDGVVAENGLV